MAGNIVGEPLRDYVQDQIELRQEIHGKTKRSTKELSYLNSRTSWIKLASGVSLERSRLDMLGMDKNYPEGQFLPMQYVLFNGTTSLNFSFKTATAGTPSSQVTIPIFNAEGIKTGTTSFGDPGSTTSTQQLDILGFSNPKAGILGNSTNPAYGMTGNTDFGLVPMPGIIDTTVRSLELGSIKRASIKIKAYNKTQFDIIDALYLRLGYTVLLEWGDSHYLDNDNPKDPIETLNSTLIETDFFSLNAETDYFVFLEKIENERKKYCGCYDALLGKVVNFKWTFAPDGTYDISLDVISLGDVVESLKMNVAPFSVDKANPGINTKANSKNRLAKSILSSRRHDSEINYMFYKALLAFTIEQKSAGLTFKQRILLAGVTAFGISSPVISYSVLGNLISYLFGNPTPPPPTTNQDAISGGVLMKYNIPGNLNPNSFENVTIGTTFNLPDIEPFSTIFQHLTDQNSTLKGDKEYCRLAIQNNPDDQWFIRLGHLLEAINVLIIPEMKGKNGSSYEALKIDTNCDTNLMFTLPNQISLDPRVCIINNVVVKPDTAVDEVYSGLEPFVYTNNNEFSYGKLMNIYVNLNFISGLLSQVDKSGDVFFMSFLRKLCNSLNVALGSVNKLEPKINPDTNILKIYDTTPLAGKNNLPLQIYPTGSNEESVFDLYGYNIKTNNDVTSNFIHNVGLTTEITPGYAEMITIGATADGYVVGEEATAFSKWNTGIVDRFKEEISTPTLAQQLQQLQQQNQQLIAQLQQYNNIKLNYFFYLNKNTPSEIQDRFIYAGFEFDQKIPSGTKTDPAIIKYDDKNIAAVLSSTTEYYKLMQAKAVKRLKQKGIDKSSGQTGFLPFNLKLDMDGLSGIKLYNKIRVNTKFLPSNYPDTMEFVATNVDHDLKDNKWVTKINSIATVSNLLNTNDLSEQIELDLSGSNNSNQVINNNPLNTTIRKQYNVYPGSLINLAPKTNNNPIIIQKASQKAKYINLFGSTLGTNFNNFIIRKGDDPNANNGNGSYALQFKKLLDQSNNKQFIIIKKAGGVKSGQLGNGADITKELYDQLVKLLNVAKTNEAKYKPILPIMLTAGNDKFHQGKTLGSTGYPTSSNPDITPANTTHTRGLAIDVRSVSKDTDGDYVADRIDIAGDNLIIDLLYQAGFGRILYHDPPHIHANIDPR
ncbi:MAG: hypothetical protein CMC82_03500 [Flavobacteriaceae bacterium]|nr:hypothetical protein [Flavobacteriaceae bacterium]